MGRGTKGGDAGTSKYSTCRNFNTFNNEEVGGILGQPCAAFMAQGQLQRHNEVDEAVDLELHGPHGAAHSRHPAGRAP